MTRAIDAPLAASLPSPNIQPLALCSITLKSGVEYVWTGIGNLVWNGQTFSGLGEFASMGPIAEGSAVKADGTTITLSGIGLSQVQPPLCPPLSPPVAVPDGQSVAYAIPHGSLPSGPFTFGPGTTGFIDPASGFGGSSAKTLTTCPTGTVGYTVSRGLGKTVNGIVFSDFQIEGGFPASAIIHAIYPVITAQGVQDIGTHYLKYGTGFNPDSLGGTGHAITLPYDVFSTSGAYGPTQFYAASIGSSLAVLSGIEIFMAINTSLTNNSPHDQMFAHDIGFAIYYDTAAFTPPTATLMYEALNDIQLGGAVKIWYGHWLNGALLGTPYLIFSGLVDKPTIEIGDTTNTITIALENRLVNLQRPNERRYTAADQRLYYPTDTGFNWVEILNDIALRWGS